MVDIDKHISYWLKSADEDWEVANQLIRSGKVRHGLFFLHLTLEKVLKAHVCSHTQDMAPRVHNLTRLAELSGLQFDQEKQEFLADMSPLNLEGRYPEMWAAIPTVDEAETLSRKTEELFEWLKNLLLKP
ncbi:MAG: HEPN domain-containing protein [bacterium]